MQAYSNSSQFLLDKYAHLPPPPVLSSSGVMVSAVCNAMGAGTQQEGCRTSYS